MKSERSPLDVRTPTPPPLPALKHREPLARVALFRPTTAVEPPSTKWIFPSTPPEEPPVLSDGPDDELVQGRPAEVVGIGADLEPGTLLRAYRSGVFPMPVRPGLMAWWSPEPRGIMPLSGLRITRSLRRSCAKFSIRIDTAFPEVISACGDARRRGAWIDPDIQAAYLRLHHWGWAHSVEAWDDYGRLAGGLYGVAIGGFFAGESMFHRQNDASKVALVGLVEQLLAAGAKLLDVQWATPHLKSLGALEVSRAQYLERLGEAVLQPQPAVFGGSPFLPTQDE
jgi:leucyl/phenylalanyl-tRNA---protein transferase